MNETEVDQLAKHLGHDAKTHREFYKLTDSTVELTTVSEVSVFYLSSGCLIDCSFSRVCTSLANLHPK